MKTTTRILMLLASTSLGLAAALPGAASAQSIGPDNVTAPPQDDASRLDEIVVTAQKRSEAVQDVPINVSVFNEQALTQAGITQPTDLQRIAPTLKYSTSIGTLASRFSIRGIGTFGNSAIEPSVASFIDGVYIPRPASLVNALLDIQAIEVLSGPQGTLFGRNASAGAISYRTGAPTGVLSDTLKVDYGTGDRLRVENVFNAPITDNVAIRVAGLAETFDGYWDNTLDGKPFGGIDTYQGRVSVRTDFSDALTWTVRGDYQKNEGDGLLNAKLLPSTLSPTTLANLVAVQNGIAPDLDVFNGRNNDFNDGAYVDDQIWGLSSDLGYSTDNGYTVRLVSGYWDWDSRQGDGDTASLSVSVLGRDLRYVSQSQSHELQLISPQDVLLGGRLDYVAGLYFFDEDLGILASSNNGSDFCRVLIPRLPAAVFPGLTGATTADRIASCQAQPSRGSSTGDFDQNTRSLAAYGQATYALTPTLDATLGLRFTDEQKTGSYVGTVTNPTGFLIATNETTNLKLDDSRTTYRANLSWRPTGDLMVFATASTGFKSGGFNNGVTTAVLGQARIFNAETVDNYELGVKSQWFDRALTLNATAYRMDIGDFQERSIVGLVSTIRNVGEVRQQGVEFEAVARPTSNLRFNAAVAYLDSEITSYPNAPRLPYLAAISPNVQDLSGARLNYAPEWSGVVGAEIDGGFGTTPLTWTLNADVNFTSSQQQGTTIDNSPLTVQDAYSLLNARFTIHGPDDRWSLAIYGRNLTDEGYCGSTVYQVLDGPLGLRYDTDGVAGNDRTAVRCNVGTPRVVGATLTAAF